MTAAVAQITELLDLTADHPHTRNSNMHAPRDSRPHLWMRSLHAAILSFELRSFLSNTLVLLASEARSEVTDVRAARRRVLSEPLSDEL